MNALADIMATTPICKRNVSDFCNKTFSMISSENLTILFIKSLTGITTLHILAAPLFLGDNCQIPATFIISFLPVRE